MRPTLLVVLPLLAAMATVTACSSGGTPAAAPSAPSAPSALSGAPVAATPAMPAPPDSVVQLLKAAAVREELARARTGVYLDANDLGYVVKAGVIFEAIPSFDSYCLDVSVTSTSQPYMLDGKMGGIIVPGRCPRPDQLTGTVAPASP